ncbi:hypothetical protein [Undibacterium sp. TC9W]|uniref:hypothetical protein n=1 Tax=Undibacterium sp. TC9W TaxID=3413053 RepID=UPI003BF2EB8D
MRRPIPHAQTCLEDAAKTPTNKNHHRNIMPMKRITGPDGLPYLIDTQEDDEQSDN